MLPTDFFGLVGVEDPQISPDARTVIYVRARFNLAENRIERSLVRWRGGIVEPFTQGISDRAPRWSTDGTKIAFLRNDDEKKPSVYVIAADGGEPHRVAGPFSRAGAPAWSPECRRIAFAAAAPVDARDAIVAFDEKSGARHILALPYKSDSLGLSDGKRMQLHVAALDGETNILAGGAFETGSPAWSPDGRRLAYVANPGVPEGSWAGDLYIVDADGGTPSRLTTMDGVFGTPAFSRDGREIALVGLDRHETLGRRNAQLWCIPSAGGAPRSLTPDRRYSLGDATMSDLRVHEDSPPFWTTDDREIVIQRSHEGACELYAYARDGSSSREIAGGTVEIYAFSGARDGTLALAVTHALDPGSIVIAKAGNRIEIPNENQAWLAAHPPLEPVRIRPKASDGTQLDAWVIKSPAANAPLVHAIHGGPHAAYGAPYFFEFALLAALGMHVVFGNPRGSQSYGEEYADAITGRWGDLDAGDLLTIRAAAGDVVTVDPKRIAVQGGSYGGLMTTWLLGHDRGYACGVSMRAVNDYSSFGASDIANFLERELKANWDDGGRRLFELSPIRAAAAIEAPLLIMHSERDFRCPIDQGEQLFSRLRLLGKTVEFVRFTGDGHDLSRSGSPRNRLLRYRALVHWLRAHLGVEQAQGGAGWLFAPFAGEPADAIAAR